MRAPFGTSVLLVLPTLVSTAFAQELMVVDATNDRIMLVSAVDGSMINANFIALGTGAGTVGLPIQAISNGAGEIWISDQTSDTVHRWSDDGTTYLGQWGTGRDNMRGLHIDFGRVWLCNAGTGGAGYGLALKQYDMATTFIASHTMPGSPFGIISHNGELLVSDITEDRLIRVDPATGAVLGFLHDSDGITGVDFPGQLAKTAAGNILTVGLVTPAGIFEYDPNGVQINYFDSSVVSASTPQGVQELSNGNILMGAGNGLYLYNRGTATYSLLVGSIDANYISPRTVSVSTPTVYCTAGTSTNGCVPAIAASAQPSVSLATSCVLSVTDVEGQKSALFFYGIDNSSFSPLPWGGGSSFLCVKAPTQRMTTQSSGGTSGACDGTLTQNWDAFQTSFPGALGSPFSVGNKVYAQAWYRDPPAAKTTNLSDAVELTYVP